MVVDEESAHLGVRARGYPGLPGAEYGPGERVPCTCLRMGPSGERLPCA